MGFQAGGGLAVWGLFWEERVRTLGGYFGNRIIYFGGAKTILAVIWRVQAWPACHPQRKPKPTRPKKGPSRARGCMTNVFADKGGLIPRTPNPPNNKTPSMFLVRRNSVISIWGLCWQFFAKSAPNWESPPSHRQTSARSALWRVCGSCAAPL